MRGAGIVLEQAWLQVARETMGLEGHVVPRQWFANITAPGISADDRRRLDVTLVASLNRAGFHPEFGAGVRSGSP